MDIASTLPHFANNSVTIRHQILVDTDALGHVACVVTQEGVQIALRIAVVGAPAGQVVHIVVSLATQLGVVATVVPLD